MKQHKVQQNTSKTLKYLFQVDSLFRLPGLMSLTKCPNHQIITHPKKENWVTLISVKITLVERSVTHVKENKNQDRYLAKQGAGSVVILMNSGCR